MAGRMLLFLVLENIQRLPVASGSASVFKRASRRIFLNQFTGGTELDKVYFLRFHAIFFLRFHAISFLYTCSITPEWRNARLYSVEGASRPTLAVMFDRAQPYLQSHHFGKRIKLQLHAMPSLIKRRYQLFIVNIPSTDYARVIKHRLDRSPFARQTSKECFTNGPFAFSS